MSGAKTETKMMKVIKDYGDVLKGFGVTNPVFLMTHECTMAVMNPDGLEWDEEKWQPCHSLPKHIMNTPGVIGIYDGVLMIEVYNYNRPIAPQNNVEQNGHIAQQPQP
jgi:hypothetical protein